MKKGILAVLLVFGLLMISAPALTQTNALEVAGQEIAQAVREAPISLSEYAATQIDYWAEILARVLKTGKPILMFGEGASKTGLSVIAIENILMDRANLVIGTTLLNNEPAQFIWGIEVTVDLSGILGEIFSRFKPAIYVVDGNFLWGFGFELRPD